MNITLIPSKTAVLLSPARSASTSLRMTLDKHPGIAMHGEIFGLNAILGISSKVDKEKLGKLGIYHRNINTQDFANLFFPYDNFVYGLNLLYAHWFTPNNFRFIDGLMASQPKVILLWRRDLVARLKSELLFKFNNNFLNTNYLENFTLANAIADFDEQVCMFKRIESDLRHLENVMSFRVDFEDIIADRDKSVMNGLQTFLGVDYFPIELSHDIKRNQRADLNKATALVNGFITENMDKLQRYRDVRMS